MQVLEMDEANAYAALGVANVLTEHGKINESMDIYKALKENCPNMSHALVNLGHLSVFQQSFVNAINFYNKALELFEGGRNLEIELYLSKAYYVQKDYFSCRKLLEKLMIRYPHDLRLRFNLAKCLTQQATDIFNKSIRKVSETKETIASLEYAKKLTQHLINIDTDSQRKSQDVFAQYLPSNLSREAFDQQRQSYRLMFGVAAENLKFIKDILKNSEDILKNDAELEEQLHLQENFKAHQIQSIQSLKEKEEQERLAKLREIQEKEQEIAAKHEEEAAAMALQMMESYYTTTKSKGGNKKRGAAGDESEEDERAFSMGHNQFDRGIDQREFGNDEEDEEPEY